MLAPNKQNLILLKKQKKLFKSGHKLLKEKRTGLIINFLEMARTGRNLEFETREYVSQVIQNYRQSLTFSSTRGLLEALPETPAHRLQVQRKRVSGVYMDTLSYQGVDLQRPSIKRMIAKPLSDFAKIFPKLLELSQLKINIQRLAQEIQKVSRQIINLETRCSKPTSRSSILL
jgi:V/A-type H+-transporting ATPase subunit D